MTKNSLTLLTLNQKVQDCLETQMDNRYWITAEINELNSNKNGHTYLELIEKDELTNKIVAKSRAIIWAFTYRMLKPYFESITRESLKSGIKVLIQVNVSFHEIYGISLTIYDIDPSYTLGKIAQQKEQTIKQLEEDGIINMNKELNSPYAPQKIAIISSATAAGFGDFQDQLHKNNYGFRFYTKLFPAIMQGERTKDSVISALDKIYSYESFFDYVVIIRGGGSKADLIAFDDYELAANIAQYPLPVLSGIGHERDESVVDMVTHVALKTPTAVAQYLINQLTAINDELIHIQDEIQKTPLLLLSKEKTILDLEIQKFAHQMQKKLYVQREYINRLQLKIKETSLNKIQANIFLVDKSISTINQYKKHYRTIEAHKLNEITGRLKQASKQKLTGNKLKIEFYQKSIQLLDPQNVLKRGFAIVRSNDKIITKQTEVTKNLIIEIELKDGKFKTKAL